MIQRSAKKLNAVEWTTDKFYSAARPPDGMKQGERRWVTNDGALPQVSDGGCDYIDVEFDLVTATVTRLACHGEA